MSERIGQFNIIRQVAKTDFSEVFEATAPSGRRVCIKQMSMDLTNKAALDLLALKQEASVLATIHHENVMEVIEFGEQDGKPFLALEWIDGQPLSHMIAEGALNQADVLEIIGQVTLGLCAIHEKGILHRDLKPDNLMVNRSGDQWVAKIADFGLAGQRSEGSKEFVGTLSYVSPEQAGLVDWPVEAQADLYSLGIILYECLTGACPFTSADASALLVAHLSQKPAAPSSKINGLHPLLEKIILKLLEKEPAKRYRSAQGLHADLVEVKARLKVSNPSDDLILDGIVPAFSRIRNVFVGRSAELEKLNGLFQSARRGQFSICLVSGVAGAGKSTLLREFENKSLIDGGKFAYGKCYEFSRALPYFCLSEALANLLKRLNLFSETSRQQIFSKIREAVGDLDSELVQLVPSFKTVFPNPKPAKYMGEGRQKELVSDLVTRLFKSISHKGSPLVIILDDLQWADRTLLELLQKLTASGFECPALIVGTYRSEEVDGDHPLSQLLNSDSKMVSKFEIGPLEADDVRLLNSRALSVSETGHEPLDRFVLDKAKGNPLFSIELLKALLTDQILTVDGAAGAFDGEKAEKQKLPNSIVDMVIRRVSALSPAQQTLIGHAALIGTAFTFEQLESVVGLPREEIHQTLKAMLVEQVLKLNRAKAFAFFHDKIHEACRKLVPPDQRSAVHLKYLKYLETLPRTDDLMFSLAVHALHSTDAQRIVEYCTCAGEIALQKNANEDARTYFSQAEEALGHFKADLKQIINIKFNLAECFLRLGRYKEARTYLDEVQKGSSDKLLGAKARAKVAECYQREGRHEESKAELYAALETLRFRIRGRWFWLPIFLDRLGILLFSLLRRFGSRTPAHKEMDLAITGVLKRLWMVHVVNDTSRLTHISYRLLYVASKIGVSEELALAYQYLSFSIANSARPNIPLGLKYARRAVDLARAVEAHEVVAGSLVRMAAYFTWQGKSTEALEYSEKAREMLIALGNLWDVGNAIIFSYFAHRTLGFLDKALATAHSLVKIAEETGSQGMMASGKTKVAEVLFLMNRFEEGESQITEVFEITKKNKLVFDYFQTLKVYGYANLYRGKLHDAIKLFDKAAEIVDNSPRSVLAAYRSDAYLGWCETALRVSLAEKKPPADPARIQKYLAAAEKSERFYRELGHVLRLKGWLAHLSGQKATARKFFESALTLFRAQERPIDVALTESDQATLLGGEGNIEAQQILKRVLLTFTQLSAEIHAERCRGILKTWGVADSDSQQGVDRQKAEKLSSALLEISVASVSSFDPMDQARALLDKTIALLKAERAILFTPVDGGKMEFKLGRNATSEDIPPSDGYSNTVIKRVSETREPIVVVGTAEGVLMGAHSVVEKNLSSMMAAPILLRDQLMGVLYIDNKLTRGIYKEEDANFLLAIAKHIGVALEVSRAAKMEIEKSRLESDLKVQLALAESSKRVQVLVDNMQQALFSVDATGMIVEPVSKFSQSVFGYEIANKPVGDVVFGHLPKESEDYSRLATTLSVVFGEGSLQWDLMGEGIPTRVEWSKADQRTVLRIKTAPLWNDQEQLEKILFVVEDIRHLEELERLAKEQSQRAMALQEMADVERQDLVDFFAEFQEAIASLPDFVAKANKSDSVHTVMRPLHTLKGNAGTLRLAQIAAAIHQGESRVLEAAANWESGQCSQELAVQAMLEALVELRTVVEGHVTTARRILRLDDFVDSASATGSGERPIKSVLSRYVAMVEHLAKSLGKSATLTCAGEDTSAQPQFLKGLNECLLHLLRNAVDHGLETPEERLKAGKEESGRIEVKVIETKEHIEVVIQDDGRGIDGEAIAAIAVQRGLLKAEEVQKLSSEEKMKLIFKPGFSSRTTVTETSGRGVGLDVVMERIQQMQGVLHLASVVSRGTTFRLVFPRQVLASLARSA